MEKPAHMREHLSPAEQIQCLWEVNQWNTKNIEELNLEQKDIFVIIGATRSGKGTLLTAIQGRKMSFFRKNEKSVRNTVVGLEASTKAFLAPIDS